MNTFSLSIVCFRILAVFMLLQAVAAIPVYMVTWAQGRIAEPRNLSAILGILGAATYLLLVILLLVFAKPLARIVTRGRGHMDSQLDLRGYDGLLSTGFALLGAWVLISDIPAFIRIVMFG